MEPEVEELIARIAGKFVLKKREEAVSLLSSLPESAELTLYSNDYEKMLDEVRKAGLEVVAEIPLVKAVVVKGTREKLLHTLSLDVVEAADTPRKVKALSESG